MLSREAPCCCHAWIGDLARVHARTLVAVARREGLAPDDALDAVQEGFHTLLTRPDRDGLRARPDDAARVLAAMVRNAARNMRRRGFRARPHDPLEDDALADAAPRADDRIEDAATAAQLEGCVARLGEVHRSVVALRVLEEVSGADTARALGLTPGHVAVLLHRARKELAACLLEQAVTAP